MGQIGQIDRLQWLNWPIWPIFLTVPLSGRKKRGRIPVGWIGTVEEAADVAVMLASNGYVTGQVVDLKDFIETAERIVNGAA